MERNWYYKSKKETLYKVLNLGKYILINHKKIQKNMKKLLEL